jgi:putative heme-binding domain-containing protein
MRIRLKNSRSQAGQGAGCGRGGPPHVLLIACYALSLAAQRPGRQPRPAPANLPEVNPYSSAADIEAGRRIFLGRCGHCHGQSGEGGRGSVLNSGTFRHGGSDRELFLVIRNGVPDTEMPGAFNLPDIEVWRMVAYVKQLGRQGASDPATGDAAAGAVAYRNNGCAQCHTVGGQGGFLGPDLTDVGARRAARHLRESIVNPSADIPLDYRTVEVTTRAGKKIAGIHLNEDEYSIHLRDLSGDLRSFLKSELQDVRLPRESLMPAYPSLSKADLDNLVAYLVSLGPRRFAGKGMAIVGAKLIDGAGGPPVEDSVVIVENGRIRAAGARTQVAVSPESTRVDAAGKVIIPGLIDMHCHYFASLEEVKKYLLVQLRWGVTTTRSAGTDSPEAVALMHEAKQGKFPAPRVYTSGFGFTHPQGAPAVTANINRPASEREARAAVRTLAAQKVDFIKIWVEGGGGRTPKIAPEIRAAIVDEAGKHGIPVVAHVTAVEDLRQLADLGVTDFLHTPRDAPASPELIAYARSKALSFTPTLANMESGWHYYENPKLLENPMLQDAFYPKGWARVTDRELRDRQLAAPDLGARKAGVQQAYRFIRAMSEAGVRVLTGSDTGAELSPVPFGGGTHREIEMLVEAGLTPMAAIRAATFDSARVLTRTADPDFGVLRPGKAADLVLLDADPTVDVRNLGRIHKVMRAGQWAP